jgi:exopolyphosphatase/guanosine-5'-triphosphate,3'-diphosphate pyrophosphatase
VSSFPQRVAAIDVGSNTILLLIAEYDPAAGLTIIEEAEDQPRLGAGLAKTGRLSAEAVERAIQSLVRMRDLCRVWRVESVGAVATAAVRDAENGEEFANRVRGLGIPLRVISPELEAELAFRSAAYHFPAAGRLLVADIGGGSLELIGADDHRLELVTSLPLGAVRMTERGFPLPRLRDEIRQQLSPVFAGDAWTGARLIGSGGTFANLAGVTLARRGKPPGTTIQGVEIRSEEIESLLHELARMDLDTRRQVPGLQPGRADIIVAGLAVAAELLGRVEASSVRINQYGLREGLLLDMIESGRHSERREE